MACQVDVFILLTLLAFTGVSGQHDCTHNGQSYANLSKAPHDNGCGVLQCQYGKFVTFHEACGKELDGQCHRLNFMLNHQGRAYQCRKVGDEYKYEIAIARYEGCVDEGKSYGSLEKFRRADACREYQCQNGEVIALDPVCGKEIDGNCHRVGENFEKDGTVYNCTSSGSEGNVVYTNVPVDPQPTVRKDCVSPRYDYKNYAIFTILPLCHLRQCQNKNVKVFSQACAFKRADIQCFQINEQWESENVTYGCKYDPVKNDVTVEILTREFRKCKRAEHWYNHLEIHTRYDGCTSVQCQDGVTPPVEEGCLWSGNNQCQELNSVWMDGNNALKCILTEDLLYRIVHLDENGNVIERDEPTEATPTFDSTCPALAADIIFALDSSGSIVSTMFQKLLNFTSTLTSAFKLGEKNVRFGAVVFSGGARKVFDLQGHDTYVSLNESIHKIPFLGDVTDTDQALDLIVDGKMFSPENGGRDYAPDAVIVITDGNSTDTTKTLAAAQRVKSAGAEIIVVGVGHINEDELFGIASSTDNVFNITGYESIFSLINTLSKRTCDVVTPPKEQDCVNSVADIFYVLDSSSGVGSENFDQKLKLAIKLTRQFTISPEHVQVSAVIATSAAAKWFDLNKYSDEDSVNRALEGTPYLPGERETAFALDLILTDGAFSAYHGARGNVAHIIVIFIDGPSDDSVAALEVARKLREKGVTILVVGIDNYSHDELVGLAGDSGNVFEACSYRNISEKINILAAKLCEVTVKPTPPPPKTYLVQVTTPAPKCSSGDDKQCQHICNNDDNGFHCSCRDGYLKNTADPSKCDVIPCSTHAKADIIFVIDSSDSVGTKNYERTFDFVGRIIDSFEVGKDDVQFGAIIYSWGVVKLFDLKDFVNKDDIKKSLYQAPYLHSSTMTHKALGFVNSEDMFGVGNGGRSDVPHILVLLTDGKSGYKDLTIRFANLLKSKGIKIITIGVSEAIDKKELKAVASRREDVFFAAGYEVLENLETELVKTTCAAAS